jgi:hypothetical protein
MSSSKSDAASTAGAVTFAVFLGALPSNLYLFSVSWQKLLAVIATKALRFMWKGKCKLTSTKKTAKLDTQLKLLLILLSRPFLDFLKNLAPLHFLKPLPLNKNT